MELPCPVIRYLLVNTSDPHLLSIIGEGISIYPNTGHLLLATVQENDDEIVFYICTVTDDLKLVYSPIVGSLAKFHKNSNVLMDTFFYLN